MSISRLRAGRAFNRFGTRLTTSLAAVLCATACGAVDPSTTDDLATLEDVDSQSEALTADDGYVKSFTMRMGYGDATQIAYTHNGAKLQLETKTTSGKFTISAPISGTQKGKGTLNVTCLHSINGDTVVKTQTKNFDLSAGGDVVYTATCDASYRARKSEIVLSPTDGTGLRVDLADLPVAPTAARDITIQMDPPNDSWGRSYHFLKFGYMRFEANTERGRFLFYNDTSEYHYLTMSYRVQCDGVWSATTTQDVAVPMKHLSNIYKFCPDGQTLDRAEVRLRDIF